MRIERLVAMANDIGAFFDAEADKSEAARSVASHLQRFWDPRMRRELIAHGQAGGQGLKEVVLAALTILSADRKST